MTQIMTEKLVESITPETQIPAEDFLIHKVISPDELNRILSFNSDILIYIMGRTGQDFIRNMNERGKK